MSAAVIIAAGGRKDPDCIVGDGDSRTAGSAAYITPGVDDWLTQLARMMTPHALTRNLAVGGSYGGHTGFDGNPPLTPLDRRLVILWTGINGFAFGGQTASSMFDIVATYVATVRAGGTTRIIVCTEISSNLTNQIPAITDYSTLIRANESLGYTYSDLAANAQLMNNGNFPDGRHPGAFGPGSNETIARVILPTALKLLHAPAPP